MHEMLLRVFASIHLRSCAFEGFAIDSEMLTELDCFSACFVSRPVFSRLSYKPGGELGVHLLTVQTSERIAIGVGTGHAFPGQVQLLAEQGGLMLDPFTGSQQVLHSCQF